MTFYTLNRLVSVTIVLIIALTVYSCGGTHGGIINYCYDVDHTTLNSALQKVLHDNKNLRRDTAAHGGYNEGDYFVLLVDMPDGTYQYNFRYCGNSVVWRQDSLNSCMFIWAMYDPDNKGGWDKDFGLLNKSLKKKLLSISKVELLDRIDKVIGKQHKIEK